MTEISITSVTADQVDALISAVGMIGKALGCIAIAIFVQSFTRE
jgi:hypothetical protein